MATAQAIEQALFARSRIRIAGVDYKIAASCGTQMPLCNLNRRSAKSVASKHTADGGTLT